MEPQTSTIGGYLQYFVGILTAAVIGVVSYGAHLGSRVTTLEERSLGQKDKDDDLKEFMKSLLDAKFEGLDRRLARIEANGNGHGGA